MIIEIENDSQQPIYKYLFKYFVHEPVLGKLISNNCLVNEQFPLKISVSKLIEVPAQSVPKNYKIH